MLIPGLAFYDLAEVSSSKLGPTVLAGLKDFVRPTGPILLGTPLTNEPYLFEALLAMGLPPN